MKPFITWKHGKHATHGMAGDVVFFSIIKVSTRKREAVYGLYADVVGKHISYYRTEADAKEHAEAAVEHFLKALGFWQCIVDRETKSA